jgi:hypothetical protein
VEKTRRLYYITFLQGSVQKQRDEKLSNNNSSSITFAHFPNSHALNYLSTMNLAIAWNEGIEKSSFAALLIARIHVIAVYNSHFSRYYFFLYYYCSLLAMLCSKSTFDSFNAPNVIELFTTASSEVLKNIIASTTGH